MGLGEVSAGDINAKLDLNVKAGDLNAQTGGPVITYPPPPPGFFNPSNPGLMGSLTFGNSSTEIFSSPYFLIVAGLIIALILFLALRG